MFSKNLLFIITFFFLPFFSFSQYLELGVTAGIATYEGDLSPNKNRVSLGIINPMGGIFARYNLNKFLTMRFGATYGLIAGNDDRSDPPRGRNLSFRSRIIEGSFIGEFNILGYDPYNLRRPWSPYIFAGVAFFNFSPKTKYNDKWVALQPLGTEGQGLSAYPERKKYKLTQFSIPVGGGIKYALNDTWNVGIEGGVRKTFTDYLDDVSTTYVSEALLIENNELSAILANRSGQPVVEGTSRGNAENGDWYIFMGLTVSRNFIDNGLVGSRKRFRRKKEGCPTF